MENRGRVLVSFVANLVLRIMIGQEHNCGTPEAYIIKYDRTAPLSSGR